MSEQRYTKSGKRIAANTVGSRYGATFRTDAPSNTFTYEVRCYPKEVTRRPVVTRRDSLGQARARACNIRDSDEGRAYRRISVWAGENGPTGTIWSPVFIAKS